MDYRLASKVCQEMADLDIKNHGREQRKIEREKEKEKEKQNQKKEIEKEKEKVKGYWSDSSDFNDSYSSSDSDMNEERILQDILVDFENTAMSSHSNSNFFNNTNSKGWKMEVNGGIIAMKVTESNNVECHWAHNTQTMGIATVNANGEIWTSISHNDENVNFKNENNNSNCNPNQNPNQTSENSSNSSSSCPSTIESQNKIIIGGCILD